MKQLSKIWLLSLFFAAFCVSNSYAQVAIGENRDPDADAVLELISADKGLLLPRVKLELNPENGYAPLSKPVMGMVVYNEITNEDNPDSYRPAGYYYHNGSEWVQITDTNIAAWRSVATKDAATLNTEDIYQTGAVLVGGSALEAHTQFAVVSNSRGALMPRMSTAQRDLIGEGSTDAIPDGLLIYNTTTHCYNYYSSSAGTGGEWVSVCGSLDPAKFILEDCTGIIAYPNQDTFYTQGVPLESSDTYTINVRVNETGTYTIVLSTGNGYSFYKSGVFAETGVTQVVLEGQGTPINGNPTIGDYPQLQFNGSTIDLSTACPTGLTPIKVQGSNAVFTVDNCNSTVVHGENDYKRGVVMNASINYVEVTLNISNPGVTIIEAVPDTNSNGISFRSDVETLAIGTQVVKLKASGTPINNGPYKYYIVESDGTKLCSFEITVSSNIGSFTNPAKNCLEIYNAFPDGSRPATGEYWIQQSSGSSAAVKTLCDMSSTDPGWTLVWSMSEKTLREKIYPYNSMSMYLSGYYLSADKERGTSSLKTDGATIGTAGLYDYRLAGATMQNIKQTAGGASQYKVRIAVDPTDVNDAWGKENYMIARPISGTYDLLASTLGNTYFYDAGRYIPSEGKIFNLPFTQNNASAPTQVCYAGNCRTAAITAFYPGRTPYVNHWDSGYGRVPGTGTQISTTITKHDGTQQSNYSVNPYYFNNIFGAIDEADMNHHIGKCGQSSDDYSNANDGCAPAAKYPHSVNANPAGSSTYEGRVIQWWVK